jgi:hypothetical protein
MAYLDELAAWVRESDQRRDNSSKKKRRLDQHQVAFLAARPDVITGLEAGYSLCTIHEHLRAKGRVTCTYETFRKFANRHCLEALPQRRGRKPVPIVGAARARAAGVVARETPHPAAPAAGDRSERNPRAESAAGQPQARSRPVGSFKFDPNPKSDKEIF